MSNHLYGVIEPESLSRIACQPTQAPIAIAVLEWLVLRLKRKYPEFFERAEIKVITVNYHGPYPALGIRFFNETDPSLPKLVSSAVDEMVDETLFSDFLLFLEKNSTEPWCDRWEHQSKKYRNGK